MKLYTKDQITREIAHVLNGILRYEPIKVILYGSLARGDYHMGSDMDLIVIKNTESKFTDRISEVLEFVNSSISVEPLVYTEEEVKRLTEDENGFLANALSEGTVLYEQQP